VLTAEFEAKLPFGKVKLPAGTRLDVLATDGATITVRYAGQAVALPTALTQAAP
jgi:hypothetical protein